MTCFNPETIDPFTGAITPHDEILLYLASVYALFGGTTLTLLVS
jgi:hypothetical protein